MKKVIIYDQYSNVFAEDGVTLLHASSGNSYIAGEFSSLEEAKASVESFYNNSKLLGNYEDKSVNLDKGYAELKVDFADGKKLNRVIYID